MATWIPDFVVSIDFGTAGSGWAMSSKDDFDRDPTNIHIRNWNNGTTISSKTPTAVLIRPDGTTLEAFGHEAEDKYMDLGSNRKKYYFFKQFKMMLYNKKTLSRKDLLHAENGKPLPAILVFSLAIRFLKDDVLKHCSDRLLDAITVDDIHWTLTVPAIGNEQAKQFMREAAEKAGIDSSKMTIVLEPEAASCLCRKIPTTFVTGEAPVSFEPGSKYIIMDCGGGTVDICCHEILEDGALKEIYRPSGIAIGGVDVDVAFEVFLANLFGRKRMKALQTKYPKDYLHLFREFEVKKHSFEPDNDKKVTLPIPSNLIKSKYIERNVQKAGYKDEIAAIANKIRISHECFKEEMFDEVMKRFCSTVANVCMHDDLQDVKTLILAGGFAESRVLQEAVKLTLPRKDVICIQDADLAVLKGAVLYGHDKGVIEARIARWTYGVSHYVPFDKQKHSKKKAVKGQGSTMDVDLIYTILEEGREMPADLEIEGIVMEPLTKGQPTVSCTLYAIDEEVELPKYVDDPRCHKLGKISAPITDRSMPLDQQLFQFKFKFGGTEITASCIEVQTGERMQTSIDFLD